MDAQVTFHHVGPAAFARVRERVLGLHEGQVVDGSPEVILCRGVRGQVEFDEQTGDLRVRLDVVPDIVTRGYVLGWLHDALLAAGTEPAPAGAAPAEGPAR
jgi:hypothetical protein